MRALGWKTPRQVLMDYSGTVQQMFDKPTKLYTVYSYTYEKDKVKHFSPRLFLD